MEGSQRWLLTIICRATYSSGCIALPIDSFLGRDSSCSLLARKTVHAPVKHPLYSSGGGPSPSFVPNGFNHCDLRYMKDFNPGPM
jgi:hypothetical protein